jgi:NADPH2:quinone reductase
MQMRALSITRPGGPEVLEIIEIPRPTPGPGKVLIRNHAVGVNFVETLIRRGRLPPTLVPIFPLVPGQEGAGVIVSLGDDVAGLAAGMRVLWMDDPFEAHGYAEYSVVRANNVVPIADNVTFEMAAAVPVVHATARNQIYNLYGRAEGTGRWALARNAAGGAGTALVETAAAAGLKVIAVASMQKLAFARVHGAIETIDYKTENVPERVRAITGGEGVALALNPIGGDTVLEDLNLLAPLGQLILYGLITGMPTGDVWAAMMQRITAGLTVSVASIDAYMRHCPTQFRRILESIASDLANGKIRPSIFESLPLSEGARAHSMLESGSSTGKLVFRMSAELPAS